MKRVVIDTNVLCVANGQSPQAGPACMLQVVERLDAVRKDDQVCLDQTGFILNEYLKQRLSLSGQPGVGDAFFKWLFQNQANPQHCRKVEVTPLNDEGTEFAEFPSDRRLARFDPADRKFVAVSRASGRRPAVVLNAVDSDWWECRQALQACGVPVEFLCPAQFTEQ
jgi:hypothetical protein